MNTKPRRKFSLAQLFRRKTANRNTMPSVAVLPFDDMSEKGDHGYFCEGIAEEIINALYKVAGLRVASRVASFRFAGKRADIAEIGNRLNVQSVVEGSLRLFGEHLRITAQLVDTSTGYHLWTQQYDRDRADLFKIQEDIAEQIALALCTTLKQNHYHDQDEIDPRAYDYFLRGRHYFAAHTADGFRYARHMFRNAVELEPNYGRAWAWLAYTQGLEYMYFDASPEKSKEALESCAKALNVAPDWSESHIAAGLCHCIAGKCDRASAEFRTAIRMNPHRFEAWYFFARAMISDGKNVKALQLLQKAANVRPEDYQAILLQAQLFVSMGDEEQANEASQKGLERARAVLKFAPDENRALNMGAIALQRLGSDEEALRWMNASVRKAPNDPIVLYNAACFHTLRGEAEEALDCLEGCLDKVGTVNQAWILNDSDLDGLREHPRFVGML